jgi:Transposase IS4
MAGGAQAASKDPRQVVGGSVWAKAGSISRDFKRILLGNQFEKSWIEGKVVSVSKRKASEVAKRATTYVLARYPCEVHDGVQQFKEKEIALQNLKDQDPQKLQEAPLPPLTTNQQQTTTATGGGNEVPSQVEDETTAGAVAVAVPPFTSPNGLTNSNGGGGSVATGTTANTRTTASTTTTNSTIPVVETHGRKWYNGNTTVDVNGKHSSKYWKLQDQYGRGHEFTPGCDKLPKPNFKALDYFLAVFPNQQLQEMQERTSAKLTSLDSPQMPTSIGEILKFMGILIIITRFEFGTRASLWCPKGRNRFIPPPNLGHTTGMSRERFDVLWRYMVWSEQPKECPPGMSHEEFRWSLVQDFVDNFNNHREAFYFSSYLICADESISRWYGLGGNWINMGLPHYVAMDRKPEHGCEIQNACDGISGIMMRLKLVKSQSAEASASQEQRNAAPAAESR